MNSRRPKVLLFSTLYPSSVRPGHGIFVETRLRELLKTGGVEALVMAPVPWFPSTHPRFGDYARMARTPARETWNGIEVEHPRYPLIPKVGMTLAPLMLAAACLGPMRRLMRQGFDFDVIDAHYYYPDGVAAALLAKWLGKPLAITARGSDLNVIGQMSLPRKMIRWAAYQAEASIGVCQALVDALRLIGSPPERLHVMRNGVDLERFKRENPDECTGTLGVGGSPLILSVGRLVDMKGHHLTLEALTLVLDDFPQAKLVVVGEGPMEPALKRKARDLGIESRVHFAGAVPQSQLKYWYSAADSLVLASSREGWANVLLESMACGTPVIATRIDGTIEVVQSGEVGVLVERTARAIADGVLATLRRRPDPSAVRRYAEGFSWHHTSQAQIGLFRAMTMKGRSDALA